MPLAPIANTTGEDGQASDTPHEKATFAGGCFWCMEPPFDELPGVISTTSGYTGGHTKNPTYEQVSAGVTGHAEAVEVVYDPAKITYAQLLDVFWKNIDPITPNRQFCDVGTQYRAAIYYHDEKQQRLAEASKKALESSGRFKQPIVTEVAAASPFYRAEEYHQDYYKKNPIRFNYYKYQLRTRPAARGALGQVEIKGRFRSGRAAPSASGRSPRPRWPPARAQTEPAVPPIAASRPTTARRGSWRRSPGTRT